MQVTNRIGFHVLLGQVKVGGKFGQRLGVLWHLFDHLREILHVLAVAVDALLLVELFQLLGDGLGDDGDVLVAQLHPHVVVVVQDDLLDGALGGLELVHVVLNVDQVVGHRLEGQLVKQRGHDVEAPVHDEDDGLGLLGALAHRRLVGFVGVQLLLEHLGELTVALVISEMKVVMHRIK